MTVMVVSLHHIYLFLDVIIEKGEREIERNKRKNS